MLSPNESAAPQASTTARRGVRPSVPRAAAARPMPTTTTPRVVPTPAERCSPRTTAITAATALRGGDRGDDADLAVPNGGVDEPKPGDIAEPGRSEPPERAAAGRIATGREHGWDGRDEPDQHHPGKRRQGTDRAAGPRGAERRRP